MTKLEKPIKKLLREIKAQYRICIILGLYILNLSYGFAQESIYDEQVVTIEKCKLNLTDKTILPTSVAVSIINDDSIANPKLIDDFTVRNTQIIFSSTCCNRLFGKKVLIKYRTLNFDVESKYFGNEQIRKDDQYLIVTEQNRQSTNNEIIDQEGLFYSGSFARGFSVGNSQSLILNSNFNLQLQGDLGDGLSILAAITDDNIPIQPNGNTRLIQEFDQVYLTLKKDNNSITAGDFILDRPKSYFINYFKKLQGLQVNYQNNDKERAYYANGVVGVTRGKFARQVLDIREGNQGPYKLVGNGGERFLIVLSGTEKVYYDGQLLERGLDYDYIIDYNRAEITFTPKILVTRERRIIVEYEYRDQNYRRSSYATNHHYQKGRISFHLNAYSEQDSKNATGDIVLDSMDLSVLSQVGDRIEQSFTSGIRPLDPSLYNPNNIYYTSNFDIPDNEDDPFFLEYSNDPNDTLFIVSFAEVGPNQGSYVIDENQAINGRVYRYVGPGMGSYEPVNPLIPPQKRQMFSVGSQFKMNQFSGVKGEVSLSNLDLNRFSEIDNADNTGYAALIEGNYLINLDSSNRKSINIRSKFEFLSQDFFFLNPYRSAEFNRDWNLPLDQLIDERQTLAEIGFSLQPYQGVQLSYDFSNFEIGKEYKGLKHQGAFNFKDKRIDSKTTLSLVKTDGFGDVTKFLRPRHETSYLLNRNIGLKVGVFYDGEVNERRSSTGSNNLLPSSFSYDLTKIYFKNSEDTRVHYSLDYTFRNDKFPFGDQLIKSIDARELTGGLGFQLNSKNKIGMNFGWRDFEVLEQELLPQPNTSRRTFLGKYNHQLNIMNGFVTSNSGYLITSGQEPKVEFFFEEVEQGQGDYIYVGNEDTTLINENFRYAPELGTGNYIRLNLINNEFISTNNQELQTTLRIEPKRLVKRESKKVVSFFSRFSTLSTIKINRKINQENRGGGFSNVLNFSSSDTNIVAYNGLINHSLFINKGRKAFDVQFSMRQTSTVFTQISGREERSRNTYDGRLRINLKRGYDFIFLFETGSEKYVSALFESRNLDVDLFKIEPSFSLRPSNDFRLNMGYSLERKKQNINAEESSTSHRLNTSVNYRKSAKTSITSQFSLINVQFEGVENSPIEFDLLNGLKDGRNYLWSLLLTRRLSNNLDMNISYEGRKNGSFPTVHIARAQIKATF